ncbi:MAG TPA: ABC transporter substrate-binding protein [Gemmatimonadales bacterium]|jgi:iron complex transport system substrate-binding protein|nr:ABC transporter substrate-binding protein [Gemmatimonadales bacterium]
MRVVSLLPAATEIVAALGGVGRLVGVSHECDFPPEVRSLPRVTRTRVDPAMPSGAIDRAMAEAKRTGVSPVEVDVNLVAHLRPDLLIGQSVCDVCAVGEGELARLVTTLMPTPWVVTLHAHTLDEVFLDIRKVGEALELRDEAEELDAGLRYRLRRVSVRAARLPKPRVLVLEWLDPPYVAGHWVPDLVTLAGGQDVGSAPGEPSRPRPWDELAALAPDVVVVALCGFDIPRAQAELAAVTDPQARALLGRRVEFLDGNAYTSRPGPRLVDAADLLARLIHG